MAGSNNENLIRTLKKDECLSPLYEMVKSIRPKTVIRKNKNLILDELNIEKKKDMNKTKKNKFEIFINNENSNMFSYLKEKDKKKIKNNLTNFNNKRSNLSIKTFNMFSTSNIKKKNELKCFGGLLFLLEWNL